MSPRLFFGSHLTDGLYDLDFMRQKAERLLGTLDRTGSLPDFADDKLTFVQQLQQYTVCRRRMAHRKGKKLSNSQACCMAQLCLAAA